MKENVWNTYSDEDMEMIDALIQGYKFFLDNGKTERECVRQMISTARQYGYVSLEEVLHGGHLLRHGSKIYAQTKGKAVMFVNIGLFPMEEGMNILGAHIDSPRRGKGAFIYQCSVRLSVPDSHQGNGSY